MEIRKMVLFVQDMNFPHRNPKASISNVAAGYNINK